MPIEQESRAEYLQALLQQRKQLNANNNSGLLNPSVSNDIQNQAMLDTTINQKTSVNDIEKPEEKDTSSGNWFTNLINKAEGFLTNMANSFLTGVFGAVEGVVDLGANIIGAIGEGTGWYESKPFNDFVETDYAKGVADFMTDTLGYGISGIINTGRNISEYGTDYLKDAFTNPSVVKDKYHTGLYGNDNLTPDRTVDNEVEEFAMGVSQSIGFMLPSIVTGQYLGQAGALGSMGISATGKGAEEAIQEGASASQALGYGVASGAIEVASELVVGKALGAVGLGTGKVMGLIGKKGTQEAVKIGSKTFIKELAQNMFEEGMEEVFSATLEPLTKAIYKGKDALEQYKNVDYWLGTNGHFNESVLGQFTSGAVTSGITGNAVKIVNKVTLTKKVGADGYPVISKYQEIMQNDAELQKTKKGSLAYNKLNENSAKLWSEFIELEDRFIKNSSNEQAQEMAKILGNPNEYAKYITTDTEIENNGIKDYLKELSKNTDTFEKRITRDYFNDLQYKYGTDYKIEFGDIENDNNAYVDSKNKVIRINDKLVAEKGGALLTHEYFGHVLGDNLSSASRQALYNSIRNTEWYKNIESKLVNAYQINDEYYQKLDSQTKKNTYYQDEVIAKYLEDVFGKTNTNETIKHLKKVFSQPTLIDRILGVFNKSRNQFNTPNIIKEYAKVINSTIDTLYKLNKNDSLLKALFKEKNGYKLTENEEKIKAKHKNLFELVKDNKSQPQVAYSKNVDSKGNKLSVEQDDYFYDSIIRDSNGRLKVIYHGTNHEFNIFDLSKIGSESGTSFGYGFYFTDSEKIGKSYGSKNMKTGYLNITKPLSLDKNTINRTQLKKFLKVLDSTGDNILSNFDDVSYYGYETVLNKAVNQLLEYNDNDVDLICEIANIDGSARSQEFWDTVTEVLGYDGIVIDNYNDTGTTAYVAFRSNQFKNVDNLNPSENPDIRYSKAITEDSNGNELNKEQQEWNKDNAFVDEENRVLNLYHGSESAGFMEFNENYPIFLTAEFDNAYAYGGNYNLVNTTRYNNVDELINDFYDNYNENTDYYQDVVKISEDKEAQKVVQERIKEFEKQKSKFDAKRTQEFINNRIKWLENSLNEGYLATTEDGEGDTIYGTKDELLRQFQIDNQYNKNLDNYDYENDETIDNNAGNRIYSLYAKSTNPLIIDCRGNNFLRIMYKGEILSTDEIANRVKEEGKYDGIIFKNIMDNGALDQFNSLGVSDVYVVFNPNQVKATDNYAPTDDNDIRYSKKIDNLKGNINKDTKIDYTVSFYSENEGKVIDKHYIHTLNEFLDKAKATRQESWDKYFKTKQAKVEVSVKNGDTVIDKLSFTDLNELKKYANRLVKLQSQAGETSKAETVKPKVEEVKETKNEVAIIKDVFDEDFSQEEKYEVEKPRTKKTPNTYISVETTKDLLELVKSHIVGEEYNLAYPKTYRDFMSKTFTELNKVRDIDKTVDRIMNLLKETTVEHFNEETQKYEKIGKLGDNDIVTEKEWQSLRKDVNTIIQYAPETQAENKYTLKLEERLNKLTEKLTQNVDRAGRVRVLNNRLTRIKKNVDRFYEATDDDIQRNGLKALYAPFARLKGSLKGFKVGDLKAEINDILEWYTPDKIADKFETLPYDDEIRYQLEELYESLGEPKEVKVKKGTPYEYTRLDRGNLSTEQINKCIDILNLIDAEIRNQTKASIENKAYAKSTLEKVKQVKNWKELNILFKAIKKWKRGFAPSYVLVKEMLGGNSPLARLLTTDIQNATSNNIMYKGKYFDKLKAEMKKLDIKQRDINKKITLANGLELTTDQALYLYISLNTETNFNEINANGFEFVSDNKLSETYGKNEAQQYLDELESILPDNVKKMGKFLQDFMNTDIKQDYINWYEMRYGKFEGRNELGKIGENTYWMLNRSYQYGTNAEKVVKTPAGVFKNSISRTGSNNAILLGGAFSAVQTYIDRIGTEIYLKPIYRQAYQILNTKVDNTTIYKQLMKTDVKDVNYLQTTLNDVIGANQKQTDLLSQLMGAFSVAKLSLNIGSMMKQFASIYTSNIPIRKSTKAIITRMFNKTAREEFKKLVDEIGAIKYREGINAAVEGNVGQVQGAVKTIADMGMIGIKKIDYATIGLGAYSLMQIGQDQYGLKIGTQENIDFVKEHWNEFDITQINNNALSKNAVSRGDYGQLAKLVFSFMQGANRAAFGSQINKVALWRRNHTLDKQVLNNNVRDLENEIKNFKNENSINNNFDELSLEDDVRDTYIELQAQLKQAQDSLKDYEAYEIAGGNTIPLHMASGLIAQGIFVALINELMKHIKGKKDWDEWDIFDLGADTLIAIGVDWIPFVNVISNWVKGYDVQIPAIEVMNEIVDVIQNAKSGNWQTMIRQLALLIGDTTGIPFQTLYQYMYGAVKTFDPSIAWQMNSVLYGSSIQSATKTFNKYVEKQDTTKANQMLTMLMDEFKVVSNEKVNKELTRLSLNGYSSDVLPKSYMTEYTDDKGNTVELSAKQITTFRNYYNQATKSVNELLNVTDYKNMTDEDKARVIKKIYDSYYAMAKAKTLKIKADTKIGNYLLYSNQNAKIGQISLVLGRINNITDTKLKTRKELVFDYVNKLSGFSKGEKLLILYFAGYTSSANDNMFKAYLRSVGFTNDNIKEFLG